MNSTALRNQPDVSIGDALATSLLSYVLLRFIQWIVTSNIFAIFGRVFFVFAVSGIVATMFTAVFPPSVTRKGFNNKRDTYTKKYV